MIDKNTIVSRTPVHMSPVYAELVTITPEQADLEERTREGQGVGVSRSAYSRVECFFCGQRISSNGLAQINHKRKHVREGCSGN